MNCELFVLFLELFVLIGNRPIIGRLFGTDYRPTDNWPVRYWCIPNCSRLVTECISGVIPNRGGKTKTAVIQKDTDSSTSK